MSDEIRMPVNELPIDVQQDVIYEIEQNNPNSYTHNYFKYPCKFIPEIPRWAIKSFIGFDNVDNKLVLDPFAGSGTTLLESSLNGIQSVGAEIDDVAKLIIKVKTTKLSSSQIQMVNDFKNEIVQELIEGNYSDEEIILPEINNLDHWFREDILRDLGHLYFSIKEVADEDVRNFLLLCMASIIKRVSNADDISPKPYVSSKIIKNPPPVEKMFKEFTEKYLEGMEELNNKPLANVIVSGDATNLDVTDNSVDLAITSPPYINAFDYVRILRLENLWLDFSTETELRNKKKLYFGTESIKVKEEIQELDILDDSPLLRSYYEKIFDLDEKRALIVKKFFEDMKDNLQEIYRVLKPGSKYVIVIGDSFIRKVNIESWKVLNEISQKMGFEFVSHFGYLIKNPYIRIPRKNRGGKISIDHVLVIQK